MNLGETYLVTENGNERLGKQKLDLVILYNFPIFFESLSKILANSSLALL